MAIHIRRCHICSSVSENSETPVYRCEHCGKPFAPFYYFDEAKAEGISESGPFLSEWKKSVTYRAIVGLSLYWRENDESHAV